MRDVVYDPYYENSDIRSHVAQQDSVLLRLQGREFEHGASSSREPPQQLSSRRHGKALPT